MPNFYLSRDKRITADSFEDYCRQMDFLNKNTGLFITDSFGTILKSRHLDSDKDALPALCDMVDDEEFCRFVSHRKSFPAFVMCKKKSNGRDFVLVLPYKHGFQRGVVLRCGEENFTTLSAYYMHLCTYKDYLSSLSAMSFTPSSQKALSDIFEMKMSGIFHLLKLSSNNEMNELLSCPVTIFLQKLSCLCKTMTGCKMNLSGEATANVYIKTTINFMKLLVSCCALCFRKSGGDVSVSAFAENQELVLYFETTCASSDEFDIFEACVANALELYNVDFDILKDSGSYKIILRHKCFIKTDIIVSEIALIQQIIQELLDKSDTRKLFNCIAIK